MSRYRVLSNLKVILSSQSVTELEDTLWIAFMEQNREASHIASEKIRLVRNELSHRVTGLTTTHNALRAYHRLPTAVCNEFADQQRAMERVLTFIEHDYVQLHLSWWRYFWYPSFEIVDYEKRMTLYSWYDMYFAEYRRRATK